MTGTRITHLGSDMRMKLKVAYTLIEQLYSGSQMSNACPCHGKASVKWPLIRYYGLEKLHMRILTKYSRGHSVYLVSILIGCFSIHFISSVIGLLMLAMSQGPALPIWALTCGLS